MEYTQCWINAIPFFPIAFMGSEVIASIVGDAVGKRQGQSATTKGILILASFVAIFMTILMLVTWFLTGTDAGKTIMAESKSHIVSITVLQDNQEQIYSVEKNDEIRLENEAWYSTRISGATINGQRIPGIVISITREEWRWKDGVWQPYKTTTTGERLL